MGKRFPPNVGCFLPLGTRECEQHQQTELPRGGADHNHAGHGPAEQQQDGGRFLNVSFP